MPFFKRAKYTDQEDKPTSFVPLAILLVIGLFLVLNLITNLPLYIESLFITVEHPLLFKFPIYNELLGQIVKGDYVDYGTLQKSKLLDQALSKLSHISPDGLEDDDQRLCFLINSYNILVLKAISEKYPVQRMDEKHLDRMGSNKYFVGGRAFSLSQIRTVQLPPLLYNKPLALFLLCDGRLGSPALLNHVITVESLNSDAEKAARLFVARDKNVEYDPIHKTFVLSPFFKWNEDLFIRFGGADVFANSYLPSSRRVNLAGREVLFRSFARRFNWYLNDTALNIQDSRSADDRQANKPTTNASNGSNGSNGSSSSSSSPPSDFSNVFNKIDVSKSPSHK